MVSLARRLPLVTAVAIAMSALGPDARAWADPVSRHTDTVAASSPAPRGAASDHVVVISVDGLRPEAIERFKAATMTRLLREGSATLAAQTISPSKTLPSHTSMLTGEDVDEHGIQWNSNETHDHGHVAVPTVFGLAREHGFRTAAFFSKGKFNHLAVPGSLDHFQAPRGNGQWLAERTARDVERYLVKERPNLMFVHFGEPDYAGHVFGWMTWFYGLAVKEADRGVARVLAAADRAFGAGNYTVILTADHGGSGRSHGSDDPRSTTIPWITWGKGVLPSTTVVDAVKTMDTAGTALWLLGVAAPEGLAGVPVRSAYSEATRLAADARGYAAH
jgi:predicted AlkP superfamily pyrophosphatase or phosphodiesterase